MKMKSLIYPYIQSSLYKTAIQNAFLSITYFIVCLTGLFGSLRNNYILLRTVSKSRRLKLININKY